MLTFHQLYIWKTTKISPTEFGPLLHAHLTIAFDYFIQTSGRMQIKKEAAMRCVVGISSKYAHYQRKKERKGLKDDEKTEQSGCE